MNGNADPHGMLKIQVRPVTEAMLVARCHFNSRQSLTSQAAAPSRAIATQSVNQPHQCCRALGKPAGSMDAESLMLANAQALIVLACLALNMLPAAYGQITDHCDSSACQTSGGVCTRLLTTVPLPLACDHWCLPLMQDDGAATPQQLLAPDQRQLLAQMSEQLAGSIRAQKEAACKEVRAACEKEERRKCKQLEDTARQEQEQLVKLNEKALQEAGEMAARRKQDSQQFMYTVRGHVTPELSGSIPRSTFEAEPNSVLNKMYNGDWAYATDGQGRACINSAPAHWPPILSWLSFGSVPAEPTTAFLDECKYWQLDNLLQKMVLQQKTAAEPAVISKVNDQFFSLRCTQHDGQDVLQVKGQINNFRKRYSSKRHLEADFEAFGMTWRLLFLDGGVFLQLVDHSSSREAERACVSFGEDEQWSLQPISWDNIRNPGGSGWAWPGNDRAERLQRYPHVGLNGALHVTLRLTLCSQK